MAHIFLCLLLAYIPSALSENGIHTYNLNFSSSSPHIFSSTFGLLQQWPNTFFPYGHTVTPCEIPSNTNLYHARIDGDLPPSPEWFAFDAEMSYSIAGTTPTSHMLTYKTTKTVKCIYFDGSSAALNGAGNMDTQMVFIHNNTANIPDEPPFGPRPPAGNNRTSGYPNGSFLGAEYDRADALCAYIKQANLGGRGWGYEGLVRMNAGFELIWCDFESPSARLVSHLNVSVPVMDSQVSSNSLDLEVGRRVGAHKYQQVLLATERRPSGPPPSSRAFRASAQLGWLTASANRYGFAGGVPGRGEARVKIHSCGIFSFYDSGLVAQERSRFDEERKLLNLSSSGSWQAPDDDEVGRQEALKALMRRRRSHRADNVSVSDGIYMRKAIEERLRAFLSSDRSQCSGVDWQLVMQEITLAYSANLNALLELLRDVPIKHLDDNRLIRKWLSPIREMAHLFAMPYYEYPSLDSIKQSPAEAFAVDTHQAQLAFSLCTEQYSPVSPLDLSDSERPLYIATMEVTAAMCRVVLTTFLSVETLWFNAPKSSSDSVATSGMDTPKILRGWRHGIEELTAWLGWADQWTSCKPGCGLGQICVIPMWPISFSGGRGRGGNRTHDGPPSQPPGGGRGPPDRQPLRPGYGYGPGHGGYGPPRGGGGFGRDEEGLWEPHCMNRTETLLSIN